MPLDIGAVPHSCRFRLRSYHLLRAGAVFSIKKPNKEKGEHKRGKKKKEEREGKVC